MVHAYSRLKHLLGKRRMTVPDLQRRIQERGFRVNLKSLYRLSKEDRPLERLDLRLAGAICQTCRIPLSELITFEAPSFKLYRISAAKQKRLDQLMTKNNDGLLNPAEKKEFRALVKEAEELTLANARMLAGQHELITD